MSRILEALKLLENRRPAVPPSSPAPESSTNVFAELLEAHDHPAPSREPPPPVLVPQQPIPRTTAPRIDFVPCGNSQLPTFERADFGWGALRPKYRVVLIGAGDAQEPETRWLASRCDGVYLVISRRQTRRQEASVAVNDL